MEKYLGNIIPNVKEVNQRMPCRLLDGPGLRTGDLAAWTINASAMTKSRTKHTALAAGGNLFVSSGLYAAAGTGSTENISAQINSDGTVTSFGGQQGPTRCSRSEG